MFVRRHRRSLVASVGVTVVLCLAVWVSDFAHRTSVRANVGPSTPAALPARGDDVFPVRLSGTVEAVRATTVMVPRLAGQTSDALVVTRMATPGSTVAPGDLLVEFDPQAQIRAAMDRRAEVVDLEGQIKKRQAELAVQHAADDSAVEQATTDLERAKLDLLKIEFSSAVQSEKYQLAFEQGTAKVAQLKTTEALKDKAGAADVRILQIHQERSAQALRHAEDNSKLMSVYATFGGVVVMKSTWKGNNLGQIEVGDSLRPGQPVLDVVDPTLMQVRAHVNQVDLASVRPGQPAKIRLDAYPDLSFDGRVELLAPLGVASGITATVRYFTVVVSIRGTHPRLMPDLSASVDLLPDGGDR